MGCGTYFLFFTWLVGVVSTFGSFIVRPRSQAPLFLTIGIGCLIVAILWTRYTIQAPKREAEAQRKKKLEEQAKQEQEERQLANMEGLDKYHKMDTDAAREYQEGVAAIRRLGIMVQQSVYQEKESDWAVLGGIADGMAGPAAGIVTAANAIQDNARVKAENAARRAWGVEQNAFYQDLASQAEQKSPIALSMEELQRKYAAILSWAPSTLFSLVSLSDTKVEVDAQTGAVTVSTSWSQKDKSICIDGSFRAKIYTSDGKCAGCAYLILPKVGTAGFKGRLSGICAYPKPSDSYTVKVEPANLWELTLKDNSAFRKTDNLSVAEHRKIVSDSETEFLREMNN